MSQIIITLKYGQTGQADLAVPDNIPSQFLAEALAQALGISGDENQLYALTLVSGSEQKRISPAATLAQARVYVGSILKLNIEVTPTGQTAWLVSKEGLRFSLGRNNLIGRMDKRDLAKLDIDLSPLDTNKAISRRHATINYQNDSFILVDERSRNGTWLNGDRLVVGTLHALKSGDEIDFGPPERGVHAKFMLKL